MAVSAKVQAYIPFPVADWIKSRAEEAEVSVSIIVRDLLVEAWSDEYQSRRGPAALDPVRQNLFITVALDAILSSLGDGMLRQRTHDAYRRRLERHGLSD